jgi:PHD/YefM family antitoxin component YafN of YafNO toxin-antitoxin module
MQTIAVGEFKAKCLGVMAEVNSTGRPMLVTKRGQPSMAIPWAESLPQRQLWKIALSSRRMIESARRRFARLFGSAYRSLPRTSVRTR